MKDLKVKKIFDKLKHEKKLKGFKLINALFKYKQSGVYVLQTKLRLLIFKEEHHSFIANYRGKKATLAFIS